MLLQLIKQVMRGPRSKSKTPTPATPTSINGTPPPGVARSQVEQLIAYAASQSNDLLSAPLDARVQHYASSFNKAPHPSPSTLNIFVYHVDMGDAGQLSYRDVKLDTTRTNYRAVVETFISSVRRWQPAAHIYLVTSNDSPLQDLDGSNVHVVQLNVATDQPMFERVSAMCAYVHSSAFTADTLFLDSDAFLNTPFDPYLIGDYDIAVTTRDIPGFMSVNEGVIVARRAHPEAVRRFFQRFLATYEALLKDTRITAYYGDIRKWRGGQLSLNAITYFAAPFSPYRVISNGAFRLKALPCDPFNFSHTYGEKINDDELAEKVIVHLKGLRKESLPEWLAYAEKRAPQSITAIAQTTNVTPRRKIADRQYSLDITPPQDYEPEESIDFAAASMTQIADHFKTDKGSMKHLYTEVYAKYLESYRIRPVHLVEIGVACGSSLKMWAHYLGQGSRITGVDIRPECAALCAKYPAIDIRIGDAAAMKFDETFDVVVDDGSHISKEIVDNWNNLWPRLRPGGYYIIEDLRCTHDPSYAANFTFPKDPALFDRRHFMEWLDDKLRHMDFRRSEVEFIHFHRELAIMRKRHS